MTTETHGKKADAAAWEKAARREDREESGNQDGYPCPECDESLPSIGSLEAHVEETHGKKDSGGKA